MNHLADLLFRTTELHSCLQAENYSMKTFHTIVQKEIIDIIDAIPFLFEDTFSIKITQKHPKTNVFPRERWRKFISIVEKRQFL